MTSRAKGPDKAAGKSCDDTDIRNTRDERQERS